jgi:hypothetical protein
MTVSSTTALILPPHTDAAPATVEAVEAQSCRPREIAVVRSPGELSHAVTNTQGAASWVWLLDSGVIPRPDALEAMLGVAAAASPMPALLTSRLLTPNGEVDPASDSVAEVHSGERVLAALQQRTVPLRVARRGSLLIRSDAAAQLDPEEALDRDLVWTARLLERELGVLVPSSVAVRLSPAGNPEAVGVRTALGTLRALPPRERVWFATYFAEEATARPRSWLRRVSRRPGR